jgi:hypothetical protein
MRELPGPITDHKRVFDLLMADRQYLPGAIAEFGVNNGGSTRQLAGYGRPVYAFDTFCGLPAEDFHHDPTLDPPKLLCPGGFTPVLPLEEMFSGYPNIKPVVGRFADTLPVFPAGIKFILIYLDPDLYESHRQVLTWLVETNRLEENAAIVCDDWFFLPGARRAIEEFIAKHVYRVKQYERLRTLVWQS